MKSIMLLIFLSYSLSTYSQSQKRAWVRQDYVKAKNDGDTGAYRFLFPIGAFMYDKNNKLFIETYGGESMPIRYKMEIVDGQKKNRLINLHYNLNYITRNEVQRLSNATFYFWHSGDRIALEIVEKNRTQKYFFVDHDGGYKFININDAKEYLSNKYGVNTGLKPIKIE